MKALRGYTQLSLGNVHLKRELYKMAPKLHKCDHGLRYSVHVIAICLHDVAQVRTGISPSCFATWGDEDCIGIMSRVGHAAHGGSYMLRPLQRWHSAFWAKASMREPAQEIAVS